jgi:hypothetical protein
MEGLKPEHCANDMIVGGNIMDLFQKVLYKYERREIGKIRVLEVVSAILDAGVGFVHSPGS